MCSFRPAYFLLVVLAYPASSFAQFNCNGTCEPSPSSPTYQQQTVHARILSHNQRGNGNPVSANAGPVNFGSESYNYAIPVLFLPGRNGLNVSLTLFYNSRVWTIDKVNNKATFNADRDFPSYGFRLGFGYLESFNNGQSYLLTEPDGTKRALRLKSGTMDIFESYDSSYIDYNSTTKILRRKNGAQWLYEPGPTANIYRPIKITDTNGNYISISYMSGEGFKDQAIATIVDTLGRTITFNYDANHKLISIVGPALGGGTKTYASFTWSQVPLNYNFASPLQVADTPTSGTQINILTECTYPNGTSYRFVYGDWGIVTKIE
jgi:YD repeat-containing protein